MKLDNFLNRLQEETSEVGKGDISKNLAKEDALSLIADFVKGVKKDFTKPADRKEILNSARKTLVFYIDEIESEEEEMPALEPAPVVPMDEPSVGDDDETINF